VQLAITLAVSLVAPLVLVVMDWQTLLLAHLLLGPQVAAEQVTLTLKHSVLAVLVELVVLAQEAAIPLRKLARLILALEAAVAVTKQIVQTVELEATAVRAL
jgi:hypothetical protein